MAIEIDDTLLAIIVVGLATLLVFLYISAIEKAIESIGFTRREAGAILFVTLIFGWISIPLVPYNGWWIGISIGGALIPIIICAYLMTSRRVGVGEGLIGVVIVSMISYLVTRPEEGVGIVADFPIAFAPALAAGLYAFSAFWIDIKKAAPLAYFSGVIGTILGADVLHLGEMLSFSAPPDEFTILSIGGANIFDMVYLSGIIAVIVDIVAFWLARQERKHGFGKVVADFQNQAEGLPYAKDVQPAPRYTPTRKGRI